MGKRKYRAADVKDVRADGLLSQLADDRVVVGIDVAKRGMFAAVMDAAQRVHVIVRWLHPEETPRFVQYLEEVRGLGGIVEVVMEPSGVYGDALRHQVEQARFPVFRVNPKRTHDAAEVYDGTPSSHDAKSGAIVAKLHLDGASHPWSSPLVDRDGAEAAARCRGSTGGCVREGSPAVAEPPRGTHGATLARAHGDPRPRDRDAAGPPGDVRTSRRRRARCTIYRG